MCILILMKCTVLGSELWSHQWSNQWRLQQRIWVKGLRSKDNHMCMYQVFTPWWWFMHVIHLTHPLVVTIHIPLFCNRLSCFAPAIIIMRMGACDRVSDPAYSKNLMDMNVQAYARPHGLVSPPRVVKDFTCRSLLRICLWFNSYMYRELTNTEQAFQCQRELALHHAAIWLRWAKYECYYIAHCDFKLL